MDSESNYSLSHTDVFNHHRDLVLANVHCFLVQTDLPSVFPQFQQRNQEWQLPFLSLWGLVRAVVLESSGKCNSGHYQHIGLQEYRSDVTPSHRLNVIHHRVQQSSQCGSSVVSDGLEKLRVSRVDHFLGVDSVD